MKPLKPDTAPLDCPCKAKHFEKMFVYDKSPAGEVQYPFSEGDNYQREVYRCTLCGHFVSLSPLNSHLKSLYDSGYVDSTYEDSDGVRRTFERVLALPPEQSDNIGRAKRVIAFAERYFGNTSPRALLDVGAGTGVFVHQMKKEGWDCTALDPDERAIGHIKQAVGIPVIHADFTTADDIGLFEVISFNKVLEHVENPVSMLSQAREHLSDSGLVYVELPDGEAACLDGKEREEFFIEHFHVFSAASFLALSCRAGFQALRIERIREPSGKYTLFGFLRTKVTES